jgi:hypothetical protein
MITTKVRETKACVGSHIDLRGQMLDDLLEVSRYTVCGPRYPVSTAKVPAYMEVEDNHNLLARL